MKQSEFDRICSIQRKLIREKCGRKAAESANYGWGQSSTSVETKVYGHGIIVSDVMSDSDTVVHTWSEGPV